MAPTKTSLHPFFGGCYTIRAFKTPTPPQKKPPGIVTCAASIVIAEDGIPP